MPCQFLKNTYRSLFGKQTLKNRERSPQHHLGSEQYLTYRTRSYQPTPLPVPQKSRAKLKEQKASKEKVKDEKAQKSLEKSGIIVKKIDSAFSGAAVKVLLDNIVDNEEIKQIFDYDNNYMIKGKLNIVEECKYCGKWCKASEICCETKETQLFLLERSLKKLSKLSLDRSNYALPPLMTKRPEPKPKVLIKNIKLFNFEESMPTFLKIKKRLENMKRFYPRLYYHEKSIIDAWNGSADFINISNDVLDHDDKTTPLLWF